VPKDVIALQIRPGEGALKVGTAVQLNLFALNNKGAADLIPGNMATWSTADARVGEVNRQGRLTPRRPGSLTITATYADKTVQAVYTIVD
jgi:hypothetical protein